MHEIRYSNTNVYKFQIFRTDFLVSIVSMNFCVFIEKQFPDWTQTGAAAREASAPEASGGRRRARPAPLQLGTADPQHRRRRRATTSSAGGDRELDKEYRSGPAHWRYLLPAGCCPTQAWTLVPLRLVRVRRREHSLKAQAGAVT